MKKKNLLILTFFGVLISVFAAGFVAMTFALRHLEQTYIELQLEASKRQAENMAAFIENEINAGVNKDTILSRLQKSIMGTDVEKGFLCMFNKKDAHLVCHPNKKMIGMQVPATFKFQEIETQNEELTSEYIKNTKGGGGIFQTDKGADIAYLEPVEGTDWVLALHQNVSLIKKAVAKERKMYLIGSILAGIIIAVFATLISRFISHRYERKIEHQNIELRELNAEISQQKEEISSQKEQIQNQFSIVNSQKEQITASITYASKIQQALLPFKSKIDSFFKENFILFKPRDIVSGDFYWFMADKNFAVYVAADCTGHGVPGAFMSMLGIAFLNEIVAQNFKHIKDKTLSSNIILEKIKDKVISSLKQQNIDNQDGMDMSLCVIDKKNSEMQFSGANNPLIVTENNNLTEIKADRMPIGKYYIPEKKFSQKIIKINKNKTFFMFSDGYIDQFGSNKKGKFLKKRFYNLLKNNSNLSLKEQKDKLNKQLHNWQGKTNQIDDIIVVGFKV